MYTARQQKHGSTISLLLMTITVANIISYVNTILKKKKNNYHRNLNIVSDSDQVIHKNKDISSTSVNEKRMSLVMCHTLASS